MRRLIPCFLRAPFYAYSTIFPYSRERRTIQRGSVFVATLLCLAWAIVAASAHSPIGASSKAQSQQGVDVLEPGKPIEREIAGGETHSYRLTLAAGQYARVFVEQRRINIALSAFDAEGKKLVEADMFNIGDTELVSLLAEAATTYRLEVRAPDEKATKGRYEIKLKELRAATDRDKSAVAAERLVAEGIGILLQGQPNADSWRKAIEKYQQSIPLWQAAQDPAWEATALYLSGSASIALREKEQAFDFANRALSVARVAAKQTDEERRRLGIKVEAIALDVLGTAHNEFGDKQKAVELLNQALPLKQTIADRVGEIVTLNNLALAYQSMGDYRKTLEVLKQARLKVSEFGDRRREATLINNMCVIHSDLGEYHQAIDFCNQAIALRRELKDRSGESTVLSNLGNAYSSLGEYQKALDFYNQALAIHKGSGERQGEAISLNNIGWVYATLAEHEKALDFYNRALEIFRALGEQFREANVLSNVAVNYADQKDFRKALEINLQVLSLRRAQNNRAGMAITFNNIASCHSNLGEKQKALDYYQQSLELHRTVGNPRHMATALRNIGVLYRDLGEQQKALDYFNEGRQMARAIGDRNSEAGILAHIARVERDRGNLLEARSRIEEALAAVEWLRINVTSQQLRASFFASFRNYHEFNLDLLMRLHKQQPSKGFDAAALQASEQGRARSLLELLTEASAEIRQGVDPSLVERERMLRQSISDKADHQMRLHSAKHTEEQAAAMAKELAALTTEYEQVQAQIRQTSPRYAALTQPAPLTLKEIQSKVLDDETLLLEYAVGELKSFLWAVTPTSLNSFELPKREELEPVARRVYEALNARNQTIPNETPVRRQQRLEQAEAEFHKAAATLSQMLLGPVASELKNKRLLIVSDGVLQYVPFAALPSPGAVDARPLVVDNEIVSLPSASVTAVLRKELAGRKPADKILAVLADPVFSNADPRLPSAGKNRAMAVEEISPRAEAKRPAGEAGLADLVRLRFSRLEADEITRLAADKQKLAALDFAASRALATSAELGQYRIVHFAAHGLINNEDPGLSGIVLSLVDEQGRPQNGFLRLYDIYNLKLGADLAVLSACQTALGKEVKGEGLISLTRGFMYAGAPRVVASLWRIDDRVTAELMKRFYQGMLGDGLRPAAALRAAQVSLWKDKRWQAPHYWAAFTFQGEWK
jgi:CHAT domain-containing protein/Tfp pilus assembly protein PilF